MNNLVIMKNKQAVTSSLQVAETFGKRHDHVLRDIEHFRKDLPNFGEMFVEVNVPDSYGRDRKAYYLNRDGFTLLAMGFTGKEALNFKLQYIRAFNKMEASLQELGKDSYQISDPVTRATKWIEEEKRRQELETENKELRIPALLGNAVSSSNDTVRVGTFAKILKQNGYNIGQNRFFEWLREHGYLIRSGQRRNTPTQYAMDLKVMSVRETVISTNHGSINKFTPLITGKGQQYFINKLLKPKEVIK
ncbi:phage regulatory protein/antirepressor Ant [Lentilactobacillus buchneri]|uniref:Phage-related antirepressor n=1 Tax=Lentilactobacillus buchneri subsp. silagei CD034 TaxID=1071400 RepID=J9W085_LENBU|nr:phage regulatory protein/antirepressor Ant [Lentilactobacillus buchneri]AFR99962.1 phage-related antirepressor [Lentilactobacillus buchneri subsp. silagei CD034]MCT2901812.1 phage regulatory protein/antirepressor Ant [Lentilactobacillus buchneri]